MADKTYYKINVSVITKDVIDYINQVFAAGHEYVLINIKDTTHITMSALDLISRIPKASRVHIRVEGGYDDSRIANYPRDNYVNMHKYDNIYTCNEMRSILAEIYKIENGMNSNWSEEQKLFYFVGYLKSKIIYHPFYETAPSKDIRSLRGLFSHKTVCAGYAMILKELCDRNGISCQYVEGTCSKEDQKRGVLTHAWNIVNLNGKNIPLDLTWTASKSHNGRLLNIEDLANVNEFIKSHFPGKHEKIQDYERELTSIDGKYVRTILSLMNKDKTFDNSSIGFTRDDGTSFAITQIREQILENEYVYTYVYQKRLDNQNYGPPMIFYSKNNISALLSSYNAIKKLEKELADARKSGNKKKEAEILKRLENSEIIKEAADKVGELLFSKVNMVNALKRGDYYLGHIKTKRDEVTKKSSIEGVFVDLNFPKTKYRQKTYTRSDGTSFALEEWGRIIIDGNHQVFRYRMYELVNDGNTRTLKQNTIFTDVDLLLDERKGIVDDFLSRSRIDRKIREAGGYLGFYSKEGIRTYDPNMNRIFHDGMYKLYRIKKEDFREYRPDLTFEDMKRLALTYTVVGTGSKALVVNRYTNKPVTDDVMAKQVCFSLLWLKAAGTKYYFDEEVLGYRYAFEVESAKEVFDVINKCITQSIIKFGTIKPIEVYERVKETCGSYKYAEEIVVRMLNNSYFINVLKDFYFMQNPSSVDRSEKIEPLDNRLSVIAKRKAELEARKQNILEVIKNNGNVELRPYRR